VAKACVSGRASNEFIFLTCMTVGVISDSGGRLSTGYGDFSEARKTTQHGITVNCHSIKQLTASGGGVEPYSLNDECVRRDGESHGGVG